MKWRSLCLRSLSLPSFMPPPPPQTPLAPVVPEPSPSYVPEKPSIKFEIASISKVMWFGVLQLSAIVVAFVLVFVWLVYIISLASSTGVQGVASATPSLPAYFSATLPFLISIAIIGWAITYSSVLYLWSAFRALSEIDQSRFSTPSKLMQFLIIASPLAAILSIYELAILYSLFQLPSYFAVISGFLVLGLYLVLSILGIIGTIGGIVLGLWRVGTRYSETTLQVGAILTVLIPIVAQILVIVGAYNARNKVRINNPGSQS